VGKVTVTVNDESPKAVVHALIAGRLGERDYAGMNAVLADWLSNLPAPGVAFGQYCRSQAWTLAQVLSLLEYQAKYIFGDGLDEREFHEMWRIFGPILHQQGLLSATVARQYLREAIEVARSGASRSAFVRV